MEKLDRKAASTYHRLMILALVGQVVLEFTWRGGGWITVVAFMLVLGFLSFLLARAIGSRPFAWTVLGFVPVVGWFSSLMLVNRTNHAFRAAGLKVGFFGGVKEAAAAEGTANPAP